MTKVLFQKDGRIGRIILNRPEVMNAIDGDLPAEFSAAVAQADADPQVHVMVLSGNGPSFSGRFELQGPRGKRRLETGRPGTRRGNLWLDEGQADRLIALMSGFANNHRAGRALTGFPVAL